MRRLTPMLKIVDIFECDLRDIKSERKERFLRDSAVYTVGGEHPLPQLIVTVAATHAGLMTRNKAFYRPDVMKAHLDTFTKPFAKPVQVHHSDHVDPVGRVRSTRYVDISNRYMNPLRDFKNHFGGKTFLDAAAGTEKSFDQVNWILKNMQGMKDYQGLGYGELDLHISDAKTAEKILDERYLTVSVGFSTTEAYCSQCKQDWAGSDGPCEHTPGTMYDEVPMVLIPSNFLYEEVSWVNNPADPHAQVLNVAKIGSPALETVSAPDAINHDSAIVPILLGVTGEGIYRLDSYKDVDATRVQEILKVAKKKDSAQPELVEFEGVKFPKAAEALLTTDAKRENYVTDSKSAGDIPEHKHRVVVDPATGNGYADYVGGHSHEVMNSVVQPGGIHDYSEDKPILKGEHTHDLVEKITPLKDGVADDVTEDHNCPTCDKKMTKKKKKAAPNTGMAPMMSYNSYFCASCHPNQETENDPSDPNEGTPQDKDAVKDSETAKTPKHVGADGPKPEDQLPEDAQTKKRKAKRVSAQSVPNKAKKQDEVIELEDGAEVPEGYELIADELEITDEMLAMEDFYEKFICPILDELEAGDAKLSSAKRKGLKSSTFCGPNRSFPVPDCAHVTAARRLIGRFKGDKAGILACVSRKAKALGCDKSKDAFEPMDVVLVNPAEGATEKEIKVRISDSDDLQVVVHTLGSDVFEANKEKLYEIGKLLGMTATQVDSYVKGTGGTEGEAVALDTAIAASDMSLELNEKFADNVLQMILNLKDEDKRASMVKELLDKLIAADLLPNFDTEYNELVEENEALKNKVARLMTANRDLYVAKQTLLAETIVHISESLKKPGFTELDEEARTNKIKELTIRSVDSLNDSLRDATSEIAGAKATQPELDADATGQPGSLELEPDNKPVLETDGKVPFDPAAVRDMDDSTYQLARRLHQSFRGDPRK
jgi:predicted transcriptional regulator